MAREVGTEGKLGGQAEAVGRIGGTWKDLTDGGGLDGVEPDQTGHRSIAFAVAIVGRASGDLSSKITVDVRGEIAGLKEHDQHDGRPAQRLAPRR